MMRYIVCLFALASLAACASGPNQIAAYEPRVRDYQLPMEVGELTRTPEDGSLWSGPDDVNYLYTDHRAIRIGDLLTVRVEEFANAQRNASTQVNRESELNAQITAFLGVMEGLQAILPAGADPTDLLGAQSGSGFSGGGGTNRSEQLQATVQVMVRQVLPNGNLFVEGHRVILVNNEEHHFYVSGVARPSDIDEANAIASSRLADAEIEFTGRGVLTDSQRQGGAQRLFNRLWPF